jgi:hypothetical protein
MTMHSYTIDNLNGVRSVSRDDGWGLPNDMGNRMTARFVWEWMNGAPCVNQNGQPRPYTLARLHQLGAHMTPVLVEPEDR